MSATPEEITIENLALIVKERTKSTSSIEYVPYDKAYEPGFEDMMRRVPSVDKLFALTGFRPKTPLTEIIDRVTLSSGPNQSVLRKSRSRKDKRSSRASNTCRRLFSAGNQPISCMKSSTTLSVLVPVYNEEYLVGPVWSD